MAENVLFIASAVRTGVKGLVGDGGEALLFLEEEGEGHDC